MPATVAVSINIVCVNAIHVAVTRLKLLSRRLASVTISRSRCNDIVKLWSNRVHNHLDRY